MMLDLKQVPQTPGIYKFFTDNKIIYIGKAINLKNESLLTLDHRSRSQDFSDKLLTDRLRHFLLKLRLKLCY